MNNTKFAFSKFYERSRMKEELSDFLKIAYKYNRVKDASEAFDEFPVEDEWHKGKIENVM